MHAIIHTQLYRHMHKSGVTVGVRVRGLCRFVSPRVRG